MPKPLVAGQMFELTGYDIVARMMRYDDSRLIVVMHNNSSHYLVAVADEVRGDDDVKTGQLLYQTSYYGGDDWTTKMAWSRAMNVALNECGR